MEKELTFETAIKELEDIVEKMERGEMTLDESLEYFKKGIELSRYCSRRLDEVEKAITKLIESENGEVSEENFIPDPEVK